jgi:hypothetical protein
MSKRAAQSVLLIALLLVAAATVDSQSASQPRRDALVLRQQLGGSLERIAVASDVRSDGAVWFRVGPFDADEPIFVGYETSGPDHVLARAARTGSRRGNDVVGLPVRAESTDSVAHAFVKPDVTDVLVVEAVSVVH